MTLSSVRTSGLATQAAGEYVGVMLTGAARALRQGFYSAGRYVEDNPVAVVAAVIALLLVLKLARRRG